MFLLGSRRDGAGGSPSRGANTAVAAVSGIGGGGERDRGRPERRCCRRAGAAARTAAAGLLLPPLPGSNCTAAEGGAH